MEPVAVFGALYLTAGWPSYVPVVEPLKEKSTSIVYVEALEGIVEPL